MSDGISVGMNCEDDDCAQVMRDVWLFLDNEMDPANRAALQKHLDDCSPCLDQAGVDAKLKELLHRKCGGDRAPDQLRAKLSAHLASVSTTAVTVNRTDESVTVTSVSVTRVAVATPGRADAVVGDGRLPLVTGPLRRDH